MSAAALLLLPGVPVNFEVGRRMLAVLSIERCSVANAPYRGRLVSTKERVTDLDYLKVGRLVIIVARRNTILTVS